MNNFGKLLKRIINEKNVEGNHRYVFKFLKATDLKGIHKKISSKTIDLLLNKYQRK